MIELFLRNQLLYSSSLFPQSTSTQMHDKFQYAFGSIQYPRNAVKILGMLSNTPEKVPTQSKEYL